MSQQGTSTLEQFGEWLWGKADSLLDWRLDLEKLDHELEMRRKWGEFMNETVGAGPAYAYDGGWSNPDGAPTTTAPVPWALLIAGGAALAALFAVMRK